jgi:3-dehydroquinate synthase
MPTIDVTLPTQSYRILIEPGVLEKVGEIARSVAPHTRAMLVVDSNIAEAHGRTVRASLEGAGYEIVDHKLIADEKRKALETVSAMYDAMLAARLERQSPVIALGGGVIGDVAGFAAATYLRGVPVVQVPTTLLAMVDASIGGKTGVNFPLPPDPAGNRELGKNLIGAFWQPKAVIIDPFVLQTLKARHLRCGLAECVKHAIIRDADLIAFLKSNARQIPALEFEVLARLIERSARIKVGIVQSDEREAGERALLNLGHTFAHVIEPIGELDLLHGEAVAIGLCAAMRCAELTGRVAAADVAEIVALLRDLGLPTRLPRTLDVDRLINAMGYDKKVAAGRIRLILPTGRGSAEVVENVPLDAIKAAWEAVGAAG